MKPEELMLQERLKKINEIKEMKIDLYAYNFNQKEHASEILKNFKKLKKEEKTRTKASIAGRIILLRKMGKASFLHLQDESGKIQVYLREDTIGERQYSLFKKLDIGDFIGVEGNVFKTKMGEITVNSKKIELLSKALYSLPEKHHGLQDKEIRYRKRYLDLIVNPEVKEVFKKRAEIYKAIREFLDKKGFIEVEVPILQSQYGGANAKPFVTKINAWDMRMYLRIAYELHLKRLIAGGFEKIYALGSCFRNEGADKIHNPEFAMMEIQWAYKDYNDAMKLTEELWEYVAKRVLKTTTITYQGTKISLKAPWKRLTVKEAIRLHAKIDVDKLSDKEMRDLISRHNLQIDQNSARGEIITALFEELVESKLIQPTHITDHPKESCPLSKPHRKNPELIERIEPFINGMEVGNCYSELTDPILQRKLLEQQAEKGRGGDEEAHPMDEDYINALEHGLPPNVGIGIGVDRMVMLLTDSESIRDVILFPIMKPKED